MRTSGRRAQLRSLPELSPLQYHGSRSNCGITRQPCDAASILGVTRLTVYNWCKSGKLKCRYTRQNHAIIMREDVESLK